MKHCQLIVPEEKYLQSYLEYCREFKEAGSAGIRSVHDPDQYAQWGPTLFQKLEDNRLGRNLPEGYVPATTFWLVEDGEVIGVSNLRHRLTDSLLQIGGHIGYAIRPSRWGKGYGTLQLKLVLTEAAKLGIKRALVTCDEDNIGSARVMEKNGGVYENTVEVWNEGVFHRARRYWIDTPARYNCYLATADLYDFNTTTVMTEDVPFFLELAAQAAGPILELACGTGRVTLPLARAGHEITGLDLSPSMLSTFREKLELEEAAVRERITLVQGNMANFRLDRRFELIIIPFRAFQSLVEEEDIKSCLACVQAHLAEGGVFAVDVFRPYKTLGEDWCYPELLQWERDDPATGRRIVKKTFNERIDVEKQIIYPGYAYEVTGPDGSFRRVEERLQLKYYYHGQLRELMETAGFRIQAEYGWFDKSPVEGERELIFLCGKARAVL